MSDIGVTPALERHPTEDPPKRTETVGGSFSGGEKVIVVESLKAEGFKNQSEGVRAVLLTFAVSPEVRDAVARALKAA